MNGNDSQLYVELLTLQKELANSDKVDVSKTCGRILDICLTLPEIDCGGVYLLDDQNNDRMTLQSWANLSPAFSSTAIHFYLSSPVMTLIESNPLLVVDLVNPPEHYPQALAEELRREGLRLAVILPMRWNGRFIACINLASRHSETIENQTLESCQLISGYMAGCLAQIYEYRRAEHRELLYQTLFDQSPVGLMSIDFSQVRSYLLSLGITSPNHALSDAHINQCVGRIIVKTYNSELQRLFSSGKKEISGTFFNRIASNESRRVFRFLIYSLLSQQTQVEFETKLHTRTEKYRYLIIRCTIVPGYEENWGELLFSVLNISDLQETMQALQSSLLRNHSILYSIPDLMIVFDTQGYIEEIKPGSEMDPMVIDLKGKPIHVLGLPPDEESSLIDLFHHIDHADPNRYIHLHLPTAYGVRTYDARFALMGNDHVLMIARDITEAEEMQRRLRESDEQFRNLAEQSPNMIFINCRGRVVFANRECERVMGISRDEFYSKNFNFRSLMHPKSLLTVQRNFERHMNGEDIEPYEYQLVKRDGTVLDAIIASKLVRYNGEEALMGVITDITERKQMEEKLRQTNEDLEQFVYVASHDLQEPLRGISSYMELLHEQYAEVLDEKGKLFVNRAGLAARRLQGMIDGLLAFSRITRRELPNTTVDLNHLLDDVLATMHISEEITITRHVLPEVRGDAAQLESVLRNLLSNAIKFCREMPEIEISCRQRDEFWEIGIRDNGIGIAPAYHQEIFDIFRRLHTYDQYPGSGIGLANVKKIVERHGGTIHVESTPGEGSTFVVRLPVIA